MRETISYTNNVGFGSAAEHTHGLAAGIFSVTKKMGDFRRANLDTADTRVLIQDSDSGRCIGSRRLIAHPPTKGIVRRGS
jgi:hypothetical protein